MHHPECRERQPLDHDLHAEVRDVPAGVAKDVVEDALEVVVDAVLPAELLVEVAREHLDVPGLVHHLRGRVVLGVDPRHGLDDARGAQQRALLAVHELREHRVLELDRDLAPLLLAEVLHRRVVGFLERLEPDGATRAELTADLLGIDVDRPVEVVVAFHCEVFAFS